MKLILLLILLHINHLNDDMNHDTSAFSLYLKKYGAYLTFKKLSSKMSFIAMCNHLSYHLHNKML